MPVSRDLILKFNPEDVNNINGLAVALHISSPGRACHGTAQKAQSNIHDTSGLQSAMIIIAGYLLMKPYGITGIGYAWPHRRDRAGSDNILSCREKQMDLIPAARLIY